MPGALCTLSPSNSLVTPFGSTVISPMEENGLAPFEGGSDFASRLKADWNCRLQISAFWKHVSNRHLSLSLNVCSSRQDHLTFEHEGRVSGIFS